MEVEEHEDGTEIGVFGIPSAVVNRVVSRVFEKSDVVAKVVYDVVRSGVVGETVVDPSVAVDVDTGVVGELSGTFVTVVVPGGSVEPVVLSVGEVGPVVVFLRC